MSVFVCFKSLQIDYFWTVCFDKTNSLTLVNCDYSFSPFSDTCSYSELQILGTYNISNSVMTTFVKMYLISIIAITYIWQRGSVLGPPRLKVLGATAKRTWAPNRAGSNDNTWQWLGQIQAERKVLGWRWVAKWKQDEGQAAKAS